MADQVHFGRSGPLWPIKSTLADQVHFGRSGPLWPIKSTLADLYIYMSAGPFRGHQAARVRLPISRCLISLQSDVLSADVNVQMSDVAMVDSRTED